MASGSGTTIGVVRTGGNPVTNPTGGRKILDVAELNAGSSAIVSPGVPVGFPGNPVRLLDLHADSSQGQVVTVTMSQQLQTNDMMASYPIRGIIEFGNGGATSTVEFDIPPPDPLAAIGIPTLIPLTFPKSGVALSVPAGSIRIYARNDSNAPFLLGAGTIGSGGVTTPGATFIDPIVFAHVAYNSVFGSVPPTRTIYLAGNGNTLGAGNGTTFADIPPFATGVRFSAGSAQGFPPYALSPGFRVSIVYDPLGLNAFTYDVAPGTDGHIEFGQMAAYFVVTNTGIAPINTLNAIFDIGNF